jgi:hypothetical protein
MVSSMNETIAEVVEWSAFSLVPLGVFVSIFSIALLVNKLPRHHILAPWRKIRATTTNKITVPNELRE